MTGDSMLRHNVRKPKTVFKRQSREANDHGHHHHQRWPLALSAALFSQRAVTRIVRGFRVFLAASLRTLTRRFFGPSPGGEGLEFLVGLAKCWSDQKFY